MASGISAVVPCRHCETSISAIAEICPHCGVRQFSSQVGRPLDASDKKLIPAAVLCGILGVFGAHRFYVGKTFTGFIQLFTLGGLGLWMLYDFILIVTAQFRDGADKRVTEPI